MGPTKEFRPVAAKKTWEESGEFEAEVTFTQALIYCEGFIHLNTLLRSGRIARFTFGPLLRLEPDEFG